MRQSGLRPRILIGSRRKVVYTCLYPDLSQCTICSPDSTTVRAGQSELNQIGWLHLLEKGKGENKMQNKKKSVALEGFRIKGQFSHSVLTR